MSGAVDQRLRDLLLLLAFVRRTGGTGRPVPLRDIAARLHIPRAQVTSYIRDLLNLAGKPPFGPDDFIELDLDADGVRVNLDQRLGRPTRLAATEALALLIALGGLDSGPGAPFATVARSARSKLRRALDRDVDETVSAVERRFVLGGDDGGIGERFPLLARAVREGLAVDIVYFTAGRDRLSRRTIHPQRLEQQLGAWYVVGHDELRGETRIFKVERIREAHLAGRAKRRGPSAARPAPTDHATASAPIARIAFRGAAARLIVDSWDPSRLEKGSDAVIARVPYADAEGLANWILRFGADARVLEPREVADAVQRRAQAVLDLHS